MNKIVLFKVKEGCLGKLRAWGEEISGPLHKEAQATLSEEGVTQEGLFSFQVGEEWYALGFMEGEGLPSNKDREINQKHEEIKNECLEYIGPAEEFYHIHNDEKAK